MNHTIFIVTYRKDFPYLTFCLRSIRKFAIGFNSVLLVPGVDFDTAVKLVNENCPNCSVVCGDEWDGKGFCWHMAQIMRSDEWCMQADVIHHIDADCIFTEPVKPEDYMEDGKPLLFYESFESLRSKGIVETDKWQVCVQACLPFDILYETMRLPGMSYRRDLYPKARQLIEEKVKQKVDDYIREQRNEYPQTFAEYNTLGNVALQCFANDYGLYNLERRPWPKTMIRQAWSHRQPTQEDVDAFTKLGLA